MTSRQAAVMALFEVENSGAYSDKALKKILGEGNMPPAEKALASELTYGVIRHKMRIDFIIQAYSTQKLKRLSLWILCILRVGIYQIFFLDKIPESAAVNESVKLAKRYGHEASARFVNAVLRAAAKGGEVKILSDEIYYSHPQWLVEMLKEQYPGDYKKILEANNTPAPVTIRANTLKTTPQKLCEALTGKGINAVADGDIITLSKPGDIAALDEYKQGLFIPQDKGAYLAAAALSPEQGDLIIDVCAAPGAKTTQLAQMTQDKARIIAFDIHPHKIKLIQKNAERMGIRSITAMVHDAALVCGEYTGKADRVLADVPCSGLGTIRKKPDIKWRKNPDDIRQIIDIQKKILRASSRYVKKGGILVYSTCTYNKEENEYVIEDFLKNAPFEKTMQQQLMPHTDDCDGFFICRLKRK